MLSSTSAKATARVLALIWDRTLARSPTPLLVVRDSSTHGVISNVPPVSNREPDVAGCPACLATTRTKTNAVRLGDKTTPSQVRWFCQPVQEAPPSGSGRSAATHAAGRGGARLTGASAPSHTESNFSEIRNHVDISLPAPAVVPA